MVLSHTIKQSQKGIWLKNYGVRVLHKSGRVQKKVNNEPFTYFLPGSRAHFLSEYSLVFFFLKTRYYYFLPVVYLLGFFPLV